MAGEPNALVKIGRSNAHGYKEEHLDFEQTWEDGADFVLKAYDRESNIVYVKINKNILMEALFGDMTRHAPEEEA